MLAKRFIAVGQKLIGFLNPQNSKGQMSALEALLVHVNPFQYVGESSETMAFFLLFYSVSITPNS